MRTGWHAACVLDTRKEGVMCRAGEYSYLVDPCRNRLRMALYTTCCNSHNHLY
jgi:hypothetical protein